LPKEEVQQRANFDSCCRWILGRWSGAVDRGYQETLSSSADYNRTCKVGWTENYQLDISVSASYQTSGVVAYSTPGTSGACWLEPKNGGNSFDKSDLDPKPGSWQVRLTVAPSDVAEEMKITIESGTCMWIVKKTSETTMTAVGFSGCNMSSNDSYNARHAGPVTRVEFRKF
jgi:hypothetical protein